MVEYTCPRCGKGDFPKLAKLRIHLERKNPCRIKPKRESEIPNLEILPLPTQIYVPIGNLIQLDDTPSSPIQNIFSDNVFSNLPQNDTE
ncbi:hypothetical protein C2G38_2154085, partial [Gigaspora rosea]